MLYRLVAAIVGIVAIGTEAAVASGGATAATSTVCMSFPMALTLTLLPAESITTAMQERLGLEGRNPEG